MLDPLKALILGAFEPGGMPAGRKWTLGPPQRVLTSVVDDHDAGIR
jgi:hypothetical protein